MMFSVVECPYCMEDNDMDDYLSDISGNETFDLECAHCDEEFEVRVEFEPTFSAEKIVIDTCESCKTTTRDAYRRGKVHPYLKSREFDVLCFDCFHTRKYEEYKLNDNCND